MDIELPDDLADCVSCVWFQAAAEVVPMPAWGLRLIDRSWTRHLTTEHDAYMAGQAWNGGTAA